VNHPDLRLVFLQACESALADPRANISGVAMQLAHQNIPAVIAMQAKVQNGVANAFAAKVYSMLSRRLPIDLAVKAGREEIGNIQGLSESQKLAFGVPVVYLSNYGGLFDRARDAVDPELLPPKCPCCLHPLNEAVRRDSICSRCQVTLRCKECERPLSDPDPLGCYCTKCGGRVPPRVSGPAPEAAWSSIAPPAEPRPENQTGQVVSTSDQQRKLAELFPDGPPAEPNQTGQVVSTSDQQRKLAEQQRKLAELQTVSRRAGDGGL
jgi:hypothetical protein